MLCTFRSIIFLLFSACLVGCSFATSVLCFKRQVDPTDSSELDNADEGILPNCVESLHFKLQDLYSSLQLNEDPISFSYLLSFFMRFEMVLMADEWEAAHWMFPVQEAEVEKRHKVIATALTEMRMDLSTMEETTHIVWDVTDDVALKVLQLPKTREAFTFNSSYMEIYSEEEEFVIDPSYTRKNDSETTVLLLLMQTMFDELEKAIRSSGRLCSVYNKTKEDVKNRVAAALEMTPPIVKFGVGPERKLQIDMKEAEELATRPIVLKAMVNKVLIDYAIKDPDMSLDPIRLDNYILARSVLDLAAQPADKDAVNRLFRKIVDQTSARLVELALNTRESFMEVLFLEVEKKFQRHRRLSLPFKVIKSKLHESFIHETRRAVHLREEPL